MLSEASLNFSLLLEIRFKGAWLVSKESNFNESESYIWIAKIHVSYKQ